MTYSEQRKQRRSIRRKVYTLLKTQAATTKQIADATGLNLRKVQDVIRYLFVTGMVFRSYYGEYTANSAMSIESI